MRGVFSIHRCCTFIVALDLESTLLSLLYPSVPTRDHTKHNRANEYNMLNQRSSARNKQQREKKPLLVHSEQATASDGSAFPWTDGSSVGSSNKPAAKGGLRRLFARSPSRNAAGNAATSSKKKKNIDVRQIRATKSSTSKDSSVVATSKVPKEGRCDTPNKNKGTASAAVAVATTLPGNTRDSSKKDRPFPVSIRKSRTNPDATDPPARNRLNISTSRSTVEGSSSNNGNEYHHETSSLDSHDVLADLQQTGQQQHRSRDATAFEEKKTDDHQFEVVYGENSKLHHSADLSFGPRSSDDGDLLQPATTTTPHGNGPPTPSHFDSASQGRKPVSKTKALLSRPFGRASLPPTVGRKWVVEISSAEWDADEHRWKYRILVQRRQLQANEQAEATPVGAASNDSQKQQPHSMTAAFTWRSLADFSWLERSLRQEFHGGLLLPVLSIALGRPDDVNLDGMPVEAEKLRNWFSDVLNGVRGQGELILNHQGVNVNLMKSDSMEAFLYRNNGPLSLEGDWQGMPSNHFLESVNDTEEESFMQSFLTKPFGFAPLELCAGGGSQTVDTTTVTPPNNRSGLGRRLPLDMITCSSRALGTAATLEVQDSFVDHSTVAGGSPIASNNFAIHSELLESEKELALNYRKTALTAMEKLQLLAEEEEKIGMAWKRFAVSLSNLFSYEKDAENARLGNSKIKRENMPYRKISKSSVDDCLRVMARQKNERSSPALNALSSMISAYVADLSAVEPAVDMYTDAIFRMAFLEDSPAGKAQSSKQTESWEGRLRSLALSTMSDVKKQAVRSFSTARPDVANKEGENEASSKRNAYRALFLTNETILRQSLTTMCRGTPVRVARMAWRYWNTEAHQCALLNAASISLRNKVGIVSKDSMSKMIKLHLAQEKEDKVTELALVQRIVNIGNVKNNSSATDGAAIDSEAKVEVDNDNLNEEHSKAMRRDKAFQITRERVGRWDSKLALSIMEAVGVDDPNVRVEETTRELRLIRKYAIGLRENLQRCIEAVQLLRLAMKGSNQESQVNEKAPMDIGERRNHFLMAISRLFSGSFIGEVRKGVSKGSSPSIAVLSRAGIDMSDPFGWNSIYNPTNKSSKTSFTQGRVGDLAGAYMNARDSQTGWLLSSLSELLNDYHERIEVVESFVYMECVGIQLEKHFSQKRTQALTDFEKKTDITTAMNIATRKRMPALVIELQAKLDALGAAVSHTLVKEMKDAHLETKALKTELHELATRRLLRAREASTERVVTVLALWAKEEEAVATSELKGLGEAMTVLERNVSKETADAPLY